MLEYLIQLPCEVLGPSMLGFLELVDIIQFENAAASHESQQLLRSILPFSPPILMAHKQPLRMHLESIKWFDKRLCRIQFIKIPIESLWEVDFEHSILENIELCLKNKTSLQHVEHPVKSYIHERVTSVNIQGIQDPAVMEVVVFSLLTNSSILIESSMRFNKSNLSLWMEHIKKIGPCLCELTIRRCSIILIMLITITEYCPYLEKLSLRNWSHMSGVSGSNILLSIATNCPHLRSLEIEGFNYFTSTEANADLTAFAEKCPQLEELSLNCEQLTDQSVIALAQQCSRLKKLKMSKCALTVASLLALSERGLPLEELSIPRIPIPSAEIAAQCAHALSRIRDMFGFSKGDLINYVIQYMTGLRSLYLNSAEDHLLVSRLLVLQGHCAGLEKLTVTQYSSITPQQFCELVKWHPQLHALCIEKRSCTSTAVLVELARSCPNLQEVTLEGRKVTEEGVLTLAVQCRQLRVLDITDTRVTEETVRQLAQHCRRLTYLEVGLNMLEFDTIYSKKLRALKETKIET